MSNESILVVYYSTKSGNTKRLVDKLVGEGVPIPLKNKGAFTVTVPYVLAFPTYGGGDTVGAIPDPVRYFLNNPDNRRYLRGVIATGNTNFGTAFCLGGRMVAKKCCVPLLRKVEIFGTTEDVTVINTQLKAMNQ